MLLPRALMGMLLLAAGSRAMSQEPPRPVPTVPAPPSNASGMPNKAQPSTAQLVDRIMRLLDKNKDGKISREEAKGSPLEVVFDRLDRNHDGVLDRAELMQGRGIMGRDAAATQPPTIAKTDTVIAPTPATSAPGLPPGMRGVIQDDVRRFLKKYDSNSDGKIDLRELRSVFEDVDRNRDGLVDKAELRQAAQRLVAGTTPTTPAAQRASNTRLHRTTGPGNPPETRLAASKNASRVRPKPEQVKPSTLDIMILHLVRHYDIDKDGKLGWNEAEALLRAMDRNHDGALDADEMVEGIIALWVPPQAEQIGPSTKTAPPPAPQAQPTPANADALAGALLRRYDSNRDGRLEPLEWKAMFESLDTAHRGMLTRSELRRLFAQLLSEPNAAGPTAPAAGGAISAEGRVTFTLTMYDTNSDGRISAEEAAGTPLAGVFKQIDRDGDGYLSRQELMGAAKLLPIPAPKGPPRQPQHSSR